MIRRFDLRALRSKVEEKVPTLCGFPLGPVLWLQVGEKVQTGMLLWAGRILDAQRAGVLLRRNLSDAFFEVLGPAQLLKRGLPNSTPLGLTPEVTP